MLFDINMSFIRLSPEEAHQTFMFWGGWGGLYGVLQGPKGARCLPDGPESEPTGTLQVFHLFQTGMFSEPIKTPTSAPAFVTLLPPLPPSPP